MKQPYNHMYKLLQDHSDPLVEEILTLALAHGYTDRASSMRAAWSEATARMNASFLNWLGRDWRNAMLDGRTDYRTDPRFAPIREIAWRHHDAGIPLELFHGLSKLYRRTYQELFSKLVDDPDADADVPKHEIKEVLSRVDVFFDEAEQAMLAPWATMDGGKNALSESLRRVTHERDELYGILESLRGPVLIADEDGKLLNANQAALQTFLGEAEPGALIYRLADHSLRDRLQPIVDSLLESGVDASNSIWMDTHSGRRSFDIRIRQIEDSVKKLGNYRVILMQDVTEHLQAVDRARNAERSMTLFLAAMSHELRTPLHSVLGAADLIQDAAAEDIPGFVELLSVSAEALNATLANVLSYSRFESQSPQPRREPVKLLQSLTELVRTKEIIARRQGVEITLHTADDLPQIVQLDWSMTRQVLGNLIQNAIRFADGHGIQIDLSRQDNTLVFAVTDKGPGLPEPILEMLSAKHQILRPRETERNGTGIGLAIALRMALAMKGELCAHNLDTGTRMEFRVPLIESDAGAAIPSTSATPLLFKSCLLVEDDPISATVTLAMLKRLGLEVDHAGDLGQAEALCAEHTYDIYIVDYQLPDGSGVTLARRLRKDPEVADSPVLLLSANADLMTRHEMADKQLFSAILEKPVDTATLRQALTGVSAGNTPQPDRFLDGLTPAVKAKMAESFRQSWDGFHTALGAQDVLSTAEQLAQRAHKLCAGARIFGNTEMSRVLRMFEQACETCPSEPEQFDLLRSKLLQMQPVAREDLA